MIISRVLTDCPGTQSEAAGKTSACAGCPNQQICSTGQTKALDPAIPIIQDKLKDVKHKVRLVQK